MHFFFYQHLFYFSFYYFSHDIKSKAHIFIPLHWDQYDESMIDEAYNSHHHKCSVPPEFLWLLLQSQHLENNEDMITAYAYLTNRARALLKTLANK